MKCHICNKELNFYFNVSEFYYFKCENSNSTKGNHLIVVFNDNLNIISYSAIVNYNKKKYILYSNQYNTGIQLYSVIANVRIDKKDIATFSQFFPLIIVNDDTPDFIPLTKRLLSLKAFS